MEQAPTDVDRRYNFRSCSLLRKHRRDVDAEATSMADLVELDRNPLKVKKDEIKDIQVLRTIKRGKAVYAKPSYEAVPGLRVPY